MELTSTVNVTQLQAQFGLDCTTHVKLDANGAPHGYIDAKPDPVEVNSTFYLVRSVDVCVAGRVAELHRSDHCHRPNECYPLYGKVRGVQSQSESSVPDKLLCRNAVV